jgi:hypothetical protein
LRFEYLGYNLDDTRLNSDFYSSLYEGERTLNLPYTAEGIMKLATLLSNRLGDKYQETINREEAVTATEAITNTNNLFFEESIHFLKDVIAVELPKILEKRSESEIIISFITKEIYQLRNSVAHWRPSGDTFKQPKDWDIFIGLVCNLVYSLYKRFESEI